MNWPRKLRWLTWTGNMNWPRKLRWLTWTDHGDFVINTNQTQNHWARTLDPLTVVLCSPSTVPQSFDCGTVLAEHSTTVSGFSRFAIIQACFFSERNHFKHVLNKFQRPCTANDAYTMSGVYHFRGIRNWVSCVCRAYTISGVYATDPVAYTQLGRLRIPPIHKT